MKPEVVVVDYGMGNLLSVARAMEHCGANVQLTRSPEAIRSAERVVLPGVGAFKVGMAGLQERGLVEPLREFAGSGRPLLGICLGMQMLFELSEEFGEHAGLGLIAGRVVPIPAQGSKGEAHKIPHIGWNELVPSGSPDAWMSSILRHVPAHCSAYFVHSFAAIPAHQRERVADCFYDGIQIAAVVRSGSVAGCQFHPEKSGKTGLAILDSFIRGN